MPTGKIPVTQPTTCDHDPPETDLTSLCCGAPPSSGFCAQCHDHATWKKHCPVCDTDVPVTIREARP